MAGSTRKARLIQSIRRRYGLASISPVKLWRGGYAAKGEPNIVTIRAPLSIALELME